MWRRRAKTGGIVAAVGAAIAGFGVAVVGLRWVRAVVQSLRFALRLATLRAYRRCPNCFRVLRREARVCRSCGASVRRA